MLRGRELCQAVDRREAVALHLTMVTSTGVQLGAAMHALHTPRSKVSSEAVAHDTAPVLV